MYVPSLIVYQKFSNPTYSFSFRDFGPVKPNILFIMVRPKLNKNGVCWEFKMTLIPLRGPSDHPIMISINDMIILVYNFMVNSIIVLKYDIIIGQ